MAVPPVLIPTDGATVPRKRPRKEPRNVKYDMKDPKEAQSVSAMGAPTIPAGEEFPIEDGPETDCSDVESQVVFSDDGGYDEPTEAMIEEPKEKFRLVSIFDDMEKLL